MKQENFFLKAIIFLFQVLMVSDSNCLSTKVLQLESYLIFDDSYIITAYFYASSSKCSCYWF